MTATRYNHLLECYNSLSHARKAITITMAAMPGSQPNELTAASKERITRTIAHAKDAIACAEAALAEVSEEE